MIALPPLEAGIRTLRNPEAERLDRLYPDLPASPDQCITCRGKGSFVWWNRYGEGHTGDESVEYECSCIDQWILNRYMLYCGVELSYQRLGWADGTHVEVEAREKVEAYLDNIENYVAAGIGLILHGNKGAGKTFLSTMLTKGLLANGYDAHFTTFAGMLDALRAGWGDTDERDWFAQRIRNAGFLVLDDVGREHKQRRFVRTDEYVGLRDNTTSLSESSIDELLRHRVAAAKPTIITTNLDLDDLESHYGSNVMSLFRERSATHKFKGDDFRDTARNRTLEEINLGLTRPVVTE